MLTTLSPTQLWLNKFPALALINDPAWYNVMQRAIHANLPAGHSIFHEGDACDSYIFLIQGSTRVFKTFKNGREVILYHLHGGNTCTLTTSILLANENYPGDAETETECQVALIPASDFHLAFDQSRGFRKFVCESLGDRIRDIIMLIESIASRHVDVRLARWLLMFGGSNKPVKISHLELSLELGTAREVISRHLREFQNKGWISQERRQINIVDHKGLETLVSSK